MTITREFVHDPSLVLDLPLYKLDGAEIASQDAYGHLCTVTGALWTPQGRRFDGTDDYIDCGASSVFEFTSGDFSFIFWINTPLTGTMDVLFRQNTDTTVGYWARVVSDGRIGLRTSQAAANQNSYSDAGSVVADTWTHIGITRVGASVKFYKAGVLLGYNAEGTHIDPTVSSSNLLIGKGVAALWYKGITGEVSGYNRALSPLELQRDYLATKWRYQ